MAVDELVTATADDNEDESEPPPRAPFATEKTSQPSQAISSTTDDTLEIIDQPTEVITSAQDQEPISIASDTKKVTSWTSTIPSRSLKRRTRASEPITPSD